MKRQHLRLVIFISVLLISKWSYAQFLPIVQEKDKQQTFIAVKAMYDQGQFVEALQVFKEMLLKDPDNSNLNFLVADCLLNIDGYEKDATSYLMKAIQNTVPDYVNTMAQRKAPIFAYLKLGDLQYNDYLFDEALINYKIFKVYLDEKKDKGLLEEVNKKIETAVNARMMVENVVKVSFSEIPFVNTVTFSDFAAQYADKGNTLYFSRRRVGVTTPASSDIFYMRKVEGKWGRPVREHAFVNSDGDDNFCCVSKDGNTMYFVSNRDGKYHIYSSTRKGKTQWSDTRTFKCKHQYSQKRRNFCILITGYEDFVFFKRQKGRLWRQGYLQIDKDTGWGLAGTG